ncbi:helix-turn-helix transcriptional regulator [Streptomyces sioyaensis]|uniref:telomere-protecting terminal protein Tpg n=1 Tax=Streptomyces sioyaensis TaxID=67364 RepID=UPI0033C8A881
MGKIRGAIDRARGAISTRPTPARAGTRLSFLLRKEGGSTAAVAARLGVSQRTVQRYLKGVHQPSAKVAARLEAEVRRDWQPRVKAKAEADAIRRGVVVETRARFGFHAAAGSSDDGRVRWITQAITPDHGAELFRL